ncbi:MAG: lactonase family protein [Verrucomicrobia bacterium]|nr:lactonase family protein [Verrucomicrobiota bacterium]
MLLKSAACLLVLTTSLPALTVFIGTNTGKNTTSKGIYAADFDPVSGKLSEPNLAAAYQSPGFLAVHPKLPVLYAVGAPNKPYADATSAVAAFAIAADHHLTFLGETSTGGKGACHLAVDPAGGTVAVAHYSDGRISTVRLNDQGAPVATVSVISNQGSGPNQTRQAGPHAHGVYFDMSNHHLCVPDLGLDKVLVYPFDPATSKLGGCLPPLTTAPGAGPRHMAFSPDEKYAYVINELDNTVLAASYQDGTLMALGTVPTLPKDFAGNNTTAEIEVSPDGCFAYASNRGHDSITVFRRDVKSGALTLLQHAPCGGKKPRHFKLAPGGKWLLCAHQDANTISVLPLNPQTGEPGPPASTVPSPSPICILFAR